MARKASDLALCVSLWQVDQGARLPDTLAARLWRADDWYREWHRRGLAGYVPYPRWWLWVDFLAYSIAHSGGTSACEPPELAEADGEGGPHGA